MGAGLAARQPALQRGDRAARREGRLEQRQPGRTTRSTSRTSSIPELAGLLPVLYPGVFPNLAGSHGRPGPTWSRSCSPGSRTAHRRPGSRTSPARRYADMLRLNVAIPPATATPSPFGLLGGDLAGFPNGRRVSDDIVAIELRAIAGATYPLVDTTYTPDAAAGPLTQWHHRAGRPGIGRYSDPRTSDADVPVRRATLRTTASTAAGASRDDVPRHDHHASPPPRRARGARAAGGARPRRRDRGADRPHRPRAARRARSRSARPATTATAGTRRCCSGRSARTTATVLVYDNLPEGEYTLWVDDEPRARGVRVDRRPGRRARLAHHGGTRPGLAGAGAGRGCCGGPVRRRRV